MCTEWTQQEELAHRASVAETERIERERRDRGWLDVRDVAQQLARATIRLHGIINDLAEENVELRVRLARHVMLEAPCAAEKLAGINKEGE